MISGTQQLAGMVGIIRIYQAHESFMQGSRVIGQFFSTFKASS